MGNNLVDDCIAADLVADCIADHIADHIADRIAADLAIAHILVEFEEQRNIHLGLVERGQSRRIS